MVSTSFFQQESLDPLPKKGHSFALHQENVTLLVTLVGMACIRHKSRGVGWYQPSLFQQQSLDPLPEKGHSFALHRRGSVTLFVTLCVYPLWAPPVSGKRGGGVGWYQPSLSQQLSLDSLPKKGHSFALHQESVTLLVTLL